MRIAILLPDNSENFRKYDLKKPYFGTAPTASLEGFNAAVNRARILELYHKMIKSAEIVLR